MPRPLGLSLNHLADTLRQLGELETAECFARRALEIWEQTRDPEIWRMHYTLATIAAARGDIAAEVEWTKKCNAAYEAALALAGDRSPTTAGNSV